MNKILKRRVDAALGKIPCDLIIKNVRFLDVFSCQWRKGEISIIDGYIVGIEPGLKAKRIVQGKNLKLVPGFIDAHVHVESSLMIPKNFQKLALTHGTTTAICDPHELTNVIGIDGIKYFLSEAENLAMDLRVMLSSCVPATSLKMETNGGGVIGANELLKFKFHPKALGLAEMMNVPGILNSDSHVIDKIIAFNDRPIDGHCPMVTGKELSAYASVGISSCHESSNLKEAKEKLIKGISCWIREGSVAKDLNALAPLLTLATSTSMGFCTDDRNPLDIAHEGHIDYMIQKAISLGVDIEVAYRAASWSVAKHYGIPSVGAIAPGYRADLVLLDNAKKCKVNKVWKSGIEVGQLTSQSTLKYNSSVNTIKANIPTVAELKAPRGRVNVIGVIERKILTHHLVKNDYDIGVAFLTVLERYGHGQKPSNAYVYGFGDKLNGAIASSVGHDSHNLIVVGSNYEDMQIALASLISVGGGFCVVKNKNVLKKLDLPFGGLMSYEDPKNIEKKLLELRKASQSIGCTLEEPFLQLAFLSLPVIPSLKLTDKGLVQVDEFKIIDVRAS